MRKNTFLFSNKIMRFVGIIALHTLLLVLFQWTTPPSFLFVLSEPEQGRRLGYQEPSPVRRLQKSERRGAWHITEEIDKNSFQLGYVPEGETIVVTDYDADEDIKVNLIYNGSIYLNAYASNEDFDLAPRYIESFTGIKFASIFRRFERSKQAYGYDYVVYNVSKEDPKVREINIDATTYGPMCIQPGIDEEFMDEDCLYLNIWRPSRWRQSVNTTTMCKQKFLGGGLFRKDCDVITTTRTVTADGSVVIEMNTERSSKTIPMGGFYDEDGSLFDEDTDILENKNLQEKKQLRKGNKNQRRGQELSDTLDDLKDALNDLNEFIEEENEDESGSKNVTELTEVYDEDFPTLGTYNVDGSGLLPVMVYIHGGGFLTGSGNDAMYDGSKAAGRGQVIVITLNYRLGIFGFMPSFGWDQWKVNGGMNGFMDIVEALIWVNRNIRRFGGNPDKVTVFGPSSTPAVCLLTMCPLAAGKFQRAILQSSYRETEVENGRYVTQNGINGASCLLSSQEPYQPLEGRIEIATKFFDYIDEKHYNFPENPDPTRDDIIDFLKAFRFNSSELLQVAMDEGTVFVPQRPAASFDYNRDEVVTGTQQRRTFLTWDNDVFPRMPIDMENMNPIDMIVGVRGISREERAPRKPKPGDNKEKKPSNGGNNGGNNGNNKGNNGGNNGNNNGNNKGNNGGNNGNKKGNNSGNNGKNKGKNGGNNGKNKGKNKNDENPNSLEKQSSNETENADNIFLRSLNDSNRYLEEEEEELDGDGDRDDDFLVDYNDDRFIVDEEDIPLYCNASESVDETSEIEKNENATDSNTTNSNTTECEKYFFDFSGTTSDQDLCVSKQFGEIAARNIKGNFYGYVLDDGIDLFGYHHDRSRRHLDEARDHLYERYGRHPERLLSIRKSNFNYEYDVESMYFFDNMWFGRYGKDRLNIRKEIFNRWINFAKTGDPKITERGGAAASRKHALWVPFTKEDIGSNPSDQIISWYLYMSTDLEWGSVYKRSKMIPLKLLLSERTRSKSAQSKLDLCSWVMDDDNDNDNEFVEVLLDYNANTAFEYYVTILATLNPTINYVPDREYKPELPPTEAPTTLAEFIENASSATPSCKGLATNVISMLLETVTMLLVGFLAFG